MLDGGLHLMNNKRSPSLKKQALNSGQNSDCVTKVVDQCFDLNQFITKMDELVYS